MMYYDTISAKNLFKYQQMSSVIVIDLREHSAYQAGHIPQAINIPYDDLEKRISEMNGYNIIIFYCERGNKSLLAARKYGNKTKKVLSVYGGIHAYRGELIKDNE